MARLDGQGLMQWAAVCGVAAAALSVLVALESVPLPGDVRLARELQSWDALANNARLINAASPWRYAALAVAAVLTALRRRLGGGRGPGGRERQLVLWALAAVLVLGLLDNALKEAVRSPRPLESFGVRIEEQKSTFGFPSGHVYGNVLAYGALAVLAPAWVHPRGVLVVRAVCLAVIVLSGPARIVVGAHWPSDTLGGYLWGGSALALALAFATWAAHGRTIRSRRRSRGGTPSR